MSFTMMDDSILSELVVDVAACQRRAKKWWHVFPNGMVDIEMDGVFGTYLVGETNLPTVVPAYGDYDSNWVNAGLVSPFETDCDSGPIPRPLRCCPRQRKCKGSPHSGNCSPSLSCK